MPPPITTVWPRALGLARRAPLSSSSSTTNTAAPYRAITTTTTTNTTPYAPPAHPHHHGRPLPPPVLRHPPTQPPSHKPPEVRKTQLHRQYQSLLKSSPLVLLFQHNNVKAVELMSIRRELAIALRKVDAARLKSGQPPLASEVKLQIIQTGIFASALRVVEFFHPEHDPHTQTTALTADVDFNHGLSRRAHEIANNRKLKLELEPLLSGPLAIVAFPSVEPQYLKTVLSILSPSPPDFPAPRRKMVPDYYEPSVQTGLQKLMLLGARVEGSVFDVAGTKWVGGIDGGVDGLRAQLVHMLQTVGGSVTNTLQGASRSLYFAVEGRRIDMEEKEKPTEDTKDKSA